MYRFRFASVELIFSIVFNYFVKSSIFLVYKSQTDTLFLIHSIYYYIHITDVNQISICIE